MKLDVSESVQRSPADVFGFVVKDHVENHPRWDPQMSLEQETPGPIGVGTKIRRSRSGERAVDGEMEVTEYEPDRLMGVVIQDGPMKLLSWITVEPEGEGTRLTFTVESEDAPVAMMEEPIRGSLRRIKEMLETGE